MSNIIASIIILMLLSLAIWKIVADKRKGKGCIGCAESGGCHSRNLAKTKRFYQQIEVKQVL